MFSSTFPLRDPNHLGITNKAKHDKEERTNETSESDESSNEEQTRRRKWEQVLTEHVEGESQARQAETLKETQGAEHGDVYREGNTQTKHQHEKHRNNQHRMSTKP